MLLSQEIKERLVGKDDTASSSLNQKVKLGQGFVEEPLQEAVATFERHSIATYILLLFKIKRP